MSTKELINQIKKMDKKSPEFFELHSVVNDKYFNFDKPDELQRAATMLNMITHRGDEWMIVILANIANTLFKIVAEDVPAVSGSFEIEKKQYFFDFYTDKKSIGSVHKMLRNTVLRTFEKEKEQPEGPPDA